MFCPKCKGEFRDGFVRCKKCDEDLVESLPEEIEIKKEVNYYQGERIMGDGLVLVASYLSSIDLNLAKSRLEADNISCFVFNEEIIAMNWLYSNAVGGLKLYVKTSDLERTKEILKDDTSADMDHDPRCPLCNASNVEYENVRKRWIFWSWLLLNIPLPFFKDRWKCKNCGYSWDERIETHG